MQKYEVWERSKLRKIHQGLADGESSPDILTIIKQILADINEIIAEYKEEGMAINLEIDLKGDAPITEMIKLNEREITNKT